VTPEKGRGRFQNRFFPESLCTFRVNLTKIPARKAWVHGISRYILDSLQSDTVDGIIENTAGMISIPEERAAVLKKLQQENAAGTLSRRKIGLFRRLPPQGRRRKTDLGADVRPDAPESGER
jgi:hypothetical protein